MSELDRNVTVKPNSSNRIFSETIKSIIENTERNSIVISAEFNAHKLYKNNYFLTKQKDINYPKVNIKTGIEPIADGYKVYLTSDKFARGVFMSIDGIDNFFSDNYFDILPGQTVEVHVTTKASESDFKKQLQIKSMSDTY